MIRILGGALKVFGFLLLTILLWPYFLSRHYDYRPHGPFRGESWYNPYAGAGDRWQKANFHAHSRAWLGLTNGHFTADSVYSKYVALGYDVPTVSNYQKLSALPNTNQPNYVPVYEHGYNTTKTHQLVIGARRVSFYDLVPYQSLDNKQYVIELLGKTAELICINHPSIRNGYREAELKKLTGYQLVEVLNRGRSFEGRWDVALSAGHPVWALGNDDSHDIARPWETGSSWTMINSPTNRADDIYAALRAGRSYIVRGEGAINKYYLTRSEVRGDSLHLSFSGKPKEIRLIGQDGRQLRSWKDTSDAVYELQESDSYVRAAAYYGDFDILLNPVLRYDGKGTPQNTLTAEGNALKTFAARTLVVLTWLALFWLFYVRRWWKARR